MEIPEERMARRDLRNLFEVIEIMNKLLAGYKQGDKVGHQIPQFHEHANDMISQLRRSTDDVELLEILSTHQEQVEAIKEEYELHEAIDDIPF